MKEIKNYYTKSGLEVQESIYPDPCLTWKQEVVILRLGKVKFNKTALSSNFILISILRTIVTEGLVSGN